MNLQQKRDAGNVRRYHTARIIGEQTVAAHSFNMCLILMEVLEHPSADVLKAAMFHDLAEVFTGDIPATFKWKFPAVGNILAATEDLITEEAGLSIELDDLERRALKFADMMELCMFCCEQLELGNRNMIEILERGVDYLEQFPPFNEKSGKMIDQQRAALNHFYKVFHYHG